MNLCHEVLSIIHNSINTTNRYDAARVIVYTFQHHLTCVRHVGTFHGTAYGARSKLVGAVKDKGELVSVSTWQ